MKADAAFEVKEIFKVKKVGFSQSSDVFYLPFTASVSSCGCIICRLVAQLFCFSILIIILIISISIIFCSGAAVRGAHMAPGDTLTSNF